MEDCRKNGTNLHVLQRVSRGREIIGRVCVAKTTREASFLISAMSDPCVQNCEDKGVDNPKGEFRAVREELIVEVVRLDLVAQERRPFIYTLEDNGGRRTSSHNRQNKK